MSDYQTYDPTNAYGAAPSYGVPSAPPAYGTGYATPVEPIYVAAPQVYPVMPYPQPSYGVGPQEHPSSSTVMVLGILSLFFFGIVLGPIAWSMGSKAKKECQAGMYAESGSLNAGRICGMVATLIYVAAIGLFILAAVASAASMRW
ncbi:MAG: hypothetical protein LBE83_04180 [Propionibacteriaceae bacterium]|jgi:hypothetical protein|nr:hypothetical protein [Propionibacteriaceae bacterium]